jgi:hypothetical protein
VIQPKCFRAAANLPSGTDTAYYDLLGGALGSSGTASANYAICPCDGTFGNFHIRLSAAPGSGKSYTFTVRKNGSDTAMVVTIADSATEGTYSGTISVAEFDYFNLKVVASGSPAAATWWYDFEFTSDNEGESFYAAQCGGGINFATTEYNGIWSPSIYTPTAADHIHVSPVDGTLQLAVWPHEDTLPGGSSMSFYLNKNGTRQDGTGGTTDSSLTFNTASPSAAFGANAVTIAKGDVLYVEAVPSNHLFFVSWELAFKLVASTDGQSVVGGCSLDALNTGTDTFYNPARQRTSADTESAAQIRGPVSGVPLSKLHVALQTAPGTGDSYAITVRKNGADEALTCTVSGTATAASDLTNTVTLADSGDLWTIEFDPTGSPAGTIQAAWALVLDTSIPPPTGGGETSTGTNPDPGDDLTDFPIVFVQIRLRSGTSYRFSVTQLNDNASWTEAPGKKPGKLERVSPVRRELSTRGAYVATRSAFTLADTDRQFRTLVASNALRGAYVAYYVVSDAVRRAEGSPRRIFAGEIVSHRAEPGPRYTFEVEDVMGRRLSEYAKQPQLPPDKFTAADFPAIDILQTGADGMPIPIVCGFVSDQDETTPQGVVPATFVGDLNFDTAWGGTDTHVDAYVWSQGAFPENGVWEVYYNDPATPDTRVIVPDAAWGTVVWTPGKPGWDDTGLATDYADYNDRRYMPLFVLRSHPLAQAAREGRVFIAGNIYGVSDEADGSGPYIDSPVRLWQWLLVNYVFNRYTDDATYFSIPTLDGTYSIIDTATVAAAKAVHDARLSGGYLAGFVLGGLGQAETVFDVMQWLSEGCDFDWGINRHGQLIVSAEDTAASAVATFDQQADIEDGQYEVWTDTEGYFNRLEYTYGYRYVPPVAPPAAPAEGEPVPTKLPPHSDWRSGLVINEDTGAQTTVGEIVTYTLNNYAVQHSETAQDVANRVLARALGPQDDGPRMFRFTTGWNGLHQDGEDIELGSVINVLHPERVGASATGTDKCRVLAIEVDPLRDRVTLEGRIIG